MSEELNSILHSQLRLAIMSILLTVKEAEFVYLKEKIQSTAGNLSMQLDKLSEVGCIEAKKSSVGKRPRITCWTTTGGKKAMEEYMETLKEYPSGLQFMLRIKLSDNFAFSLFFSTFAPRNK